MKKLTFYSFLTAFVLISLFGCKPSETHFLKDESYRKQVHEQFEKRKELAAGRSKALFSVLDDKSLSIEQREAMEFLYAYMPLSDLADYDGAFFLAQVNGAIKARNTFAWGKTIPEDVFRHFVLVPRVNNENLDSARQVMFDALKDRIKGLSMEQAALEVNHWCHEKVNYRGTDERTSAPLALMKTSWGRCGEESTFTTTALRAVGIPARQCYTPRWAHTDDNHAWVEVWIDGKWHYMGACEPESVLDVAWFTGPAKRAMMVHTNVFGVYTGPEAKNETNELYSVINLLPNYTETRTIKIKVVDQAGKPVEGASVKFKVYNYAELYPLATITSSKDGEASIITGKGDLVIWANKNQNYGYAKMPSDQAELTITLGTHKPGDIYDETMLLTPPVEQKIAELPAEKVKANAIRLAQEDSIRNAYMKTFVTEDLAKTFAKENGLDADKTWHCLNLAQGNWAEIEKVMTTEKTNADLFDFLASLSEKDMRDTPAAYLLEHLQADKSTIDKSIPSSIYVANILSPRIDNELIRPWYKYLQSQLKTIAPSGTPSAEDIRNYITKNITLDTTNNYYKCTLSPKGSFDLKRADVRSRNVLFVALCRAAGIPAHINQSTLRPQYYDKGQWLDLEFADNAKTVFPKATITFSNNPSNIVKPGYATHYSIARYIAGDFVTLDFEGDPALASLPGKVTVDAGYYRLTVGSRANDGSVTMLSRYFEVKSGENKAIEVTLPKVNQMIQVHGIVDMNTKVKLKSGKEVSLKELSKGKGLYICFTDPAKEPSKHILQEIPSQHVFLNQWGGGVLFIIPSDKLSTAFDASVFKNLPSQSAWSVDNNRTFLNTVASTLKIDFSNNFPLSIYVTDNGGILYTSEGYHIGIGEDIVKIIKEESATKGSSASCTAP